MSNKREPRVYVPNKGFHDYTDAKRYGSLHFVTTGVQNKYGVSNMARCWMDALSDSSPDDFILQTSLSVLCSVGAAAFATIHGRVNYLLWQNDKYIVRTIILREEKGE